MMNVDSTDWIVAEPESKYWSKTDFLFQDETRQIIGTCMSIHRALGKGFLEIVYKDAFEHECRLQSLPYQREKKFEVNYKGFTLPHHFFADFILHDSIIVEIKAQAGFADENYAQVVNYLAVSKCPVGLLINFGENSLKFKRFALTKNPL